MDFSRFAKTAVEIIKQAATVFTANDQSYAFGYNPASQIVSQSSTNALFDRTASGGFSDSYTVDGLNRYLTAAGITVTHDARGNITGDGSKTYAYDGDNRLTSVSGGATATLAYDPAGRLYEVAGPATTRFLYDGGQAIAEYSGTNALQRRYTSFRRFRLTLRIPSDVSPLAPAFIERVLLLMKRSPTCPHRELEIPGSERLARLVAALRASSAAGGLSPIALCGLTSL